jgi:hypothetical protein
MPSATSSAIAPVGITSSGARVSSPSRMTEPFAELLLDVCQRNVEGLVAISCSHVLFLRV